MGEGVLDTMTYATGYRPATRPFPSHHALLAARTLLTSADLTVFRGTPIRQRRWGECVGASLRRCVQLWHAVRGQQMPDVSDLAAYTLGRCQERAGLDPDLCSPLTDAGAQPDLVLLAAQKVGLMPATLWPGPGDPGFAEGNVNAEPHPDLLCHAYDARGLTFHALAYARGKLRAAVEDCLLRGMPVMLALNADPLQSYNGTSVITSFPTTGQDHMLAFLDASRTDWARVDNWWDSPQDVQPWGDPSPDPHLHGTWRATWAALEQGCCDVLAVDYAPGGAS